MGSTDPGDMLSVLQMAAGYWWSQAILVAARLGIADSLEAGHRAPRELAEELDVDESSLFRLLRALASVGLFARDSLGRFGLTDRGRLLLEHHPRSLKALVLSLELPYRAWGSLEKSIRNGRPAFDEVYGCSYFEYLDAHREDSDVFAAAMTCQARLTSETVAEAYDFSRFDRIVDVGGSGGALLSAILDRHPGVRGWVFDRPAVVERQARRESRVEWVAGDFFNSDLPVADAYLLSLVLHDWSDEACHRILKAVARSMRGDARLLVVESILPPDDYPFFAKVLDLHMLACFGGAERTEFQYRALLEGAGLSVIRVHPAFGPSSQLSIIEATNC
ncbi:MAG TPA: methyltransferase [Vicinamibacteria bacterium]|jgi:hypothetical protein|nr:methyltransferase [Vicinamibacteria bacterium]